MAFNYPFGMFNFFLFVYIYIQHNQEISHYERYVLIYTIWFSELKFVCLKLLHMLVKVF
jgi:hypothetical protein